MRIVIIALSLLVCSECFADWTATIKETRKADDTLFVDTIFTDGTNIERIEVPLFQPQTKEEVLQGLKNRAATLDRKYKAEAQIVIIKPDVDKEKDKPIPCVTAIE